MSYRVKVTPNAVEQISAVVEYIADTLLEPETALQWSKHLQRDIEKLSEFPSRFRLTDEEPWKSIGIHQMPFQNFLVYFWINEAEGIVWVTAVVYQRRDQQTVLSQMPLDML